MNSFVPVLDTGGCPGAISLKASLTMWCFSSILCGSYAFLLAQSWVAVICWSYQFYPLHQLAVAKVRLQLGVWCRLSAQHGGQIWKKEGAITEVPWCVCTGQKSGQYVMISLDFDSGAFQVWHLLLFVKLRRDIHFAWCCRQIPSRWRILTNNQSFYLVLLTGSVGDVVNCVITVVFI